MPTIALSTGSLYTYGIARAFELAAQAGFEAMEVLIDHRWDSRQPHYLRRLSGEHGLPIAVVHSPFVPNVPGWPGDAVERLKESAALARAVGARVVVGHLPLRIGGATVQVFGSTRGPRLLPLPFRGQKAYRDFLLNGLAQFETDEGVLVGVENMPCKRIWGRRFGIYWLNDVQGLSAMPHVTLDTTHLGTWGLDVLEVYEKLKDRIVHVHLSNFDGREHMPLEDGHLPLAELLERLKDDGYGGVVSLELRPDRLQPEDEGAVRAHLRRMVDFCREYLD